MARREVLTGYPKDFIFKTPEKLKLYFGSESIVCLLCGKEYRTLGLHLKTIHEMEPDEYREKYGIPWTYKLSCKQTSALHAEIAKENHRTGKFVISTESLTIARENGNKQRKRMPVREVLTARNLEIMNKDKNGEEAIRRKNRHKRGTPEYRKIMQERPQCQPEITRKNIGNYWKGKKQTDEHIAKRFSQRGHSRKRVDD